jgi:hypothetical protein
MTNWSATRRSFLKQLGLGAAMLPLLHESRGGAAANGPAGRLIVIVKGNGVRPEDFWPTFPGGRPADGSLAAATFPHATAPLAPHRDSLLFVDGLTLRNWLRADGNPTGDDGDAHHDWGSLLTGRLPSDALSTVGGCGLGSTPKGCRMAGGGPSIDVAIGRALAETDPALRTPSLAVGIRGDSAGHGFDSPSWLDRDKPNTNERDPGRVFAALYGGRALPTSKGPDPALLERLRVLDFVGRDLERFGRRLGTDDRIAVQAHLAAVELRKSQLEALLANPVSCTPTAPGALDLGEPQTAKVSKVMIDLVVDAMKCGVARTASISLFDSNAYDVYFSWLRETNPDFARPGLKISEFPELHYHSIAHGGYSGAGIGMYRDANRWHVEQLAYLLERLKVEKEGTGTMLDNTVVLYVDSLSSGGGHSVRRLPWILAGNVGKFFATGRHVEVPRDTPTNGLLVSLATALGVPPANGVFGDPKFGAGALAGLRG